MSGAFKLKNGSLLLSAEAPGGMYNHSQLKKIAEICEKGSGVVKATEDQRLALFVEEDQLEQVKEELKSCGLWARGYQQGLHMPITCVGELWPEQQQDSMGTTLELSALLADIELDNPLKIGINGSVECLIPTHTLDVSIIGDTNGYKVYLGGKNSLIP